MAERTTNHPYCLRLAALVIALAAWAGPGAMGRAEEAAPPASGGEPDVKAPTVAPTSDANAGSSVRSGADPLSDSQDRRERLSLGGYGEIHANTVEGPGNDQVDLHRIVLGAQYDFTSWLTFVTELELEHAFVGEEGGGELLFEQAFIEYEACEWLRVRAGRMLVPLGLINQKHEPTSFNGVERPSFARYIIPTTWFAEGIGIRGWLSPAVTYQAYVMTSLDGSEFNALDGIREGRLEERSSLNQPAFSGRLDYFPFALAPAPGKQVLRFGASTFLGGLDNGNAGRNPGVDSNISIYSTDFEYRVSCFDFRGEFAFEDINGAEQIGNGTASEILGWYLEAAMHVLPANCRCGRLEKADALIFVRYDDFNTQYRMPAGVARNDAGDRNEWTVGFGFLPVPNFVVKVDYQIPDDATGNDLPNRFNVGVGWQF